MLCYYTTKVTTFLPLFSPISLEVGSLRLDTLSNNVLDSFDPSPPQSSVCLESHFQYHACHLMVARWLLHLPAACLQLRHKESGKSTSHLTVSILGKQKPSLKSADLSSGSLAKENGMGINDFRVFCLKMGTLLPLRK